MNITEIMIKRKSVRHYLDKPVMRADIEKLIRYAGEAPSAINLQPWEYVVTYGEEKDRLCRRLKKVHTQRKIACGPGTAEPLPEKYYHRTKKASKAMKPDIDRLGIPFNQFVEDGSCSFYGAPVAIIVLMDKLFPSIRYLDVGLSVSYLLLAAEEMGLSTCPIGLVTEYEDDIKDALNIPDDKQVLLTIALGYEDKSIRSADLKPERESIDDILTWFE